MVKVAKICILEGWIVPELLVELNRVVRIGARFKKSSPEPVRGFNFLLILVRSGQRFRILRSSWSDQVLEPGSTGFDPRIPGRMCNSCLGLSFTQAEFPE